MTPLQKQIEDIKDALASIEGNGERRVGEAERLLARLAALEKELARFIGALPAHNDRESWVINENSTDAKMQLAESGFDRGSMSSRTSSSTQRRAHRPVRLPSSSCVLTPW